jgi:hypothetical protein
MQHKMGRGDLLDAGGKLVERGWAAEEVRRYQRATIQSHPLRTKEWDYYCVLAKDYGLAVTVADNDYLGFLGVTWLDFRTASFISEDALLAFPLGKFRMPESADSGDVEVAHSKLNIRYTHENGGRRVRVRAPGFDKGRGLEADLFLEQPTMDRMVIATPFAGAPRSFYYNQKINCLRADGAVTIGNERFAFAPSEALGVLDWGRGAWTYDNTWYWGSASGFVGSRPFGFNIGYGFGDTSAATENVLFLDGRAHKLADVTFHMPAGAPDSAAWRFSSSDGRFEMDFTPIVDRASKSDLGLIKSDQHQVFGRFAGEVVLDDGARLEIRDLLGFAERVHNRW